LKKGDIGCSKCSPAIAHALGP